MNNEIPNGKSQEKLGNGDEIHSREQDVKNRLGQGIREAESQFERQLSGHEIEDIEKRAAFDYAQENGVWFDDFYSLGNHTLQGGNENTLVVNTKDNSVYKSNNLLNSQNRISNLLESVRIHNELFPETKYELVGFTGIDNGNKRAPYVEPVLKQDYVPNAEQAMPQEIADYMASIGFKQVNEHTFTNGRYTVSDLRPRNVLKDENGTIYVVDDVVSENTATEATEEISNGIRFQTVPNNPAPSTEQLRAALNEKLDGARKETK